MTEPSPSPQEPVRPRDTTPGLQPDDVRVAAHASYEVLQPVSDADWSRPAGELEWDCRFTLEHVLGALDKYSRWLATPTGERTPSDRFRDPNLSTADLLTLLQLRAGVLAVVVSAADPAARGFPIFGRPDPTGYVAIACVEIFIHTDDISRGLGVTYQPPQAQCQRALARLFPWAPTDVDPWSALRWATGRLDLPGYGPTASTWVWHAAPLSEWDGTIKTQASYRT